MSGTEPIRRLEPAYTEEERLVALAEEYVEARRAATEAAERKELVRKQILSILADRSKILAGRFFIGVSEQTRTTIDRAALTIGAKAAGFDLTRYQKVSLVKILRVVD